MNNQGFSKILVLAIVLAVLAGGVLIYWQLGTPAEETQVPAGEGKKTIKQIHISQNIIEKALLICNKIKESSLRKICIGIVNGDSTACQGVHAIQKVDCYVSLTRRMGDISVCEQLSNASFKHECLARITGDYELCKKGMLTEYCYYDVAMIEGDVSGCKKISDETLHKKCLALLEKDFSHCQDTPEEVPRDTCYFRVATLIDDYSVCQKMARDKESCVSVVKRDIQGLDCIKKGGYCEYLAAFSKDDTVCQKMENGDACYHLTALNLLGLYPLESPRGW